MLRWTARAALLASLLLGVGLPSPSPAEVAFDLELTASPSGKWVDFFSDVFAQVDGGPSYIGGPGESDGFYQYSLLPAYVTLGGGTDVFPLGADFGLAGQVYVDANSITGDGTESAPITDIEIDFAQFIADNDNIINSGYSSEFSGVTGTATIVDGDVTNVNLNSTVVFTYNATGFGLGLLPFTGTFDIVNNNWDLYCDCPETYSAGSGTIAYRWDVTGSATPVPEPVFGATLLVGAGSLAALRRRRDR